MIGLQASRRINVRAQDLLRLVRSDFLDVHAARGRGDDCNASALAIEQQAEVQLALDGAAGLDVNKVDRQAGRARLFRDEPLPEHCGGGLADLLHGAAQFHTAGLAAPARMHLGLDHP